MFELTFQFGFPIRQLPEQDAAIVSDSKSLTRGKEKGLEKFLALP
jgi:hypothetical protein